MTDLEKMFDQFPELLGHADIDKFVAFHQANPKVARYLIRRINEAVDAGLPRIGINAVSELARWDMTLETYRTEGVEFKISNNFRPIYARFIVAKHPRLADYIQLKRLFGRDNT